MKLIQTSISHNCAKARIGLRFKQLDFEIDEIVPFNRIGVWRASRQTLVPVLVDGDRTIAGSTPILLYLEERYPDPPLLPDDPQTRAECIRFTRWADDELMDASRRIAYSQITKRPIEMARVFAPGVPQWSAKTLGAISAWVIRARFTITKSRTNRSISDAKKAAAEALVQLAGSDYLFGNRLSIADITLATMVRPLGVGSTKLTSDPAVTALLAWADTIIGDQYRVAAPPVEAAG